MPNAERNAIFEEFIKNCLYKAENVLKIPNLTGNEEINEVVWEWSRMKDQKTFTYPVQWSKVKLPQ
jgi:hypothetical protein